MCDDDSKRCRLIPAVAEQARDGGTEGQRERSTSESLRRAVPIDTRDQLPTEALPTITAKMSSKLRSFEYTVKGTVQGTRVVAGRRP